MNTPSFICTSVIATEPLRERESSRKSDESWDKMQPFFSPEMEGGVDQEVSYSLKTELKIQHHIPGDEEQLWVRNKTCRIISDSCSVTSSRRAFHDNRAHFFHSFAAVSAFDNEECEEVLGKTGNCSSADPSKLTESDFLCIPLYVVARILIIADVTLRRLLLL